jgi:hypothetical protein
MWPVLLAVGLGHLVVALAKSDAQRRDLEHRKAIIQQADLARVKALACAEARRRQLAASLRQAQSASNDPRWRQAVEQMIEQGLAR